jgi:hypothetical protein
MDVRDRGSHIFHTIGSQMALKLSALRAGRPYPPPPQEDSWYSFLLDAACLCPLKISVRSLMRSPYFYPPMFCFLRGPCPTKGKAAITSSQNFLCIL